MNRPAFIARKLAYTLDGAEEVIAHTDLLRRSENLVILGEAGMGKSRLLEELDKAGGKRVTARRLISTSDPGELLKGKALVLIDALDEAPAFAEGGVVDQILPRGWKRSPRQRKPMSTTRSDSRSISFQSRPLMYRISCSTTTGCGKGR